MGYPYLWLFYDERIHRREVQDHFLFLKRDDLVIIQNLPIIVKRILPGSSGKVVCSKGVIIIHCLGCRITVSSIIFVCLSIVNRMFHMSMDYDFFFESLWML